MLSFGLPGEAPALPDYKRNCKFAFVLSQRIAEVQVQKEDNVFCASFGDKNLGLRLCHMLS